MFCLAAAVALGSVPVRAQTAAPAELMPPHDTFTVSSTSLREKRLVNVHVPAGYNSRSRVRYPVLYMPDGGFDEDFPHVVKTVDSLIALRAIRPVIVVGIPNTERRRDLTGPTRVKADSAIAPHVGGSAAFRTFIRDELFPTVNRRYHTSSERSIVGESLAGLFIMETFLETPAMFEHYIALDPSVWWNNGSIVESAPSRIAAFPAGHRTMFMANSNVPEMATAVARIADALRTAQPPGLTWTFVPRPDLTHATIFRGIGPTALANALR